jgi:hypothetical protein
MRTSVATLALLFTLVLLFTLGAATAAGAAPHAQFGDPWDGLEPTDRSPLTRLQLRPDVHFRRYQRVHLDGVHVALERDWDPMRSERPAYQQLAPADLVDLRALLADELKRRFERELELGRYPATGEDAPDVLRLSVAVLDLAVDAPDPKRSGTEPVYVLDAERMILTLELRDAVTGQLLARVIDMKQGAAAEPWTFSGSPLRAPPVDAALGQWAKALRAGLDRAFGRGP